MCDFPMENEQRERSENVTGDNVLRETIANKARQTCKEKRNLFPLEFI